MKFILSDVSRAVGLAYFPLQIIYVYPFKYMQTNCYCYITILETVCVQIND